MDFFLHYSFVFWEVLFVGVNLVFVIVSLIGKKVWNYCTRFSVIFSWFQKYKIRGSEVVDEPQKVTPILEKFEEPKNTEISADTRKRLQDVIVAARAKLSRGEWDTAMTRIVEGLSIDKNHSELNCMLAEQFERRGEWRKAELVYKDLIAATHSKDAHLFMRLAATLEKQEKMELALELYKKAFSYRSDDAKLADIIARLSLGGSQFEEARKFAKESLRLFPRNAPTLHILAQASLALDDRAAALEAYLRVKELDPYDPAIRKTIEKVTLELEMQKNLTPSLP